MVTSIAALHECMQSTHIAQAAISQCASDVSALVPPPKSPHTEIAHATATFSELGIGAAIAMLLDPLRWKEHANKLKSDPVAREDLLSRAVMLGWHVKLAIRFLTHPFWRFLGFYVAPVIIILLGITALFGIAGFIPWMGEEANFYTGFLSFVIIACIALFLNSGAKERQSVTETVDKSKEQPIPPPA